MRIALILKAAFAFVAGIVITFSQVHDAQLAMFGLLLMSAGWFLASLFFILKNSNPIINGLLLLATAGMAWYSTAFDANGATTMAWILLSAWGLFGAIAEFVFALRATKKSAERRDHLISAGLAIGLFISQISITKASDDVSHVGFFGAYAVILAVHLGLSAFSPSTSNTKA
jgi:hypothetical protein